MKSATRKALVEAFKEPGDVIELCCNCRRPVREDDTDARITKDGHLACCDACRDAHHLRVYRCSVRYTLHFGWLLVQLKPKGDGIVVRYELRNHLRALRTEQHLSQQELADKAGVTRQTISAIENCQYIPSTLLAFVLARCLGKSVTELFYLEEVPTGEKD